MELYGKTRSRCELEARVGCIQQIEGLRCLQWHMPAKETYVLGIEPPNCYVEGRQAERERGTLVLLAPGQMLEYNLKLTLSED